METEAKKKERTLKKIIWGKVMFLRLRSEKRDAKAERKG